MMGRKVDSQEALAWGIVSRVFPDGTVVSEVGGAGAEGMAGSLAVSSVTDPSGNGGECIGAESDPNDASAALGCQKLPPIQVHGLPCLGT